MATDELKTAVEAAERDALERISACGDLAGLERLRPELLGKKSALRGYLKQLGGLPAEERPAAGQIVNEAQGRVDAAYAEAEARLGEAELNRRIASERVDVSLPGIAPRPGALHPLTLTLLECQRIFTSMGFEIAEGPQTELERNNFDALNIAANHPARDMHDTFYLEGGGILRTHTSPVQVRHMLAHKPPIAIIAPGRVFRVDDIDATHSPVFHQMEGLVVDRKVSMAELKGTLDEFLRAFFQREVETIFRPSYFPFTEPSADVYMKWRDGKGEDKWLEVLGCGMVHPNVLSNVGIDPREFSGFAFGLGIDRFAMLKYGISSIRTLYENDLRMLRQFA